MAHDFTHARRGTPVRKLVQIAGRHCAVEECFEQAKQLSGLDEYEVRSWIGWYRHITLSLRAHATLVVLRSQVRQPGRRKKVGES